MTTKNRILSLALSLLMVVALFAPISTVFAAENLTIVAASDNGGTTATSGAAEAIENLNVHGKWYSANRSDLTDKISIATYTLQKSAFVDGVKIAFYFADQRVFDFSIEYSMDGETWATALERTTSAQQAADMTAETFTFAAPVEALYLQVKIYDARVLATGKVNNYGAFYSFEAFGEFDPDGIGAPAEDEALVAALAKADALDENEYRPESWAALSALLPDARLLVGTDYTNQAAIDSAAAAINAAVQALCPVDQVLALQAYQVEGAEHTNAIYHAPAACPNLRAQDGVWYSANASGDAVTSAIFALPAEAELYEIQLDWYKGTERGYEFSLYTSLDKENWTEIVPVGTLTNAAATTTIDLTAIDAYEGTALYIRFDSADGYCRTADGAVATNQWIALSEIRFYGETVDGGLILPGNFDAVEDWSNIKLDLTESLYTAASWEAFENSFAAVDYTLGAVDQATIDAAVEAIADAYVALQFVNVNEIQISHSYFSDLAGGTGWTNDALFFSEPGYTLDQYKVNNMTMQNWTRIFAVPTADEGVFEISRIVESGTVVAADEAVPENDFGSGFIVSLNYNGNNVNDAGSQYASEEFGNRNEAARIAMDLKVGDKVQLNNVIFTAADFENEGEEMQAAWLETTGSWKHRYWNTVGLGEFTPTIINRKSGQQDADGNYLARDEFENFTSASTLTKVAEPTTIVYATDNGGTTATSGASEAVEHLNVHGNWYSANRNNLPDKISYATFTLNQASNVEGVALAFYKATERSFEFAIEYSMDGETWQEALPATWSAQQAAEEDAEEFYFDEIVEALYIRVKITDARVLATDATNNYGAFYSIEVFGQTIPGGITPVLPDADYTAVETWNLIKLDLNQSLYTTDSWANFVAALDAVPTGLDITGQKEVDNAVLAIKEAYAALTFTDLEGIQISQSYYSDLAGGTAWTNATVIFTESGYTLDQYKVSGMTLANWTRIFAAPTETAGVFEITNILTAGTAMSAEEGVPENEFGTGFVLAMNYNTDIPDEVPYGSQYASQEFGNRNNAAFAAMALAVGDKVQLNNVIFSAEDFENEGEEMQAAWLETTGTWKHRYWNTVGLGEFTPTIINRPSNKTDADGNYIARDEFENFTSASTLTKYVEAEPEFINGDVNGDGEVALADLTLLAQFIGGWDTTVAAGADVNGDGEMALADLTLLAQIIGGWDVSLA